VQLPDINGSLREWVDWFSVQEPSALDRLGSAIFVNSPFLESRLMAMFTIYFDASGNSVDQPFVVVAGYIANYIQWRYFGHFWAKVHKDFGLDLPFHMSEFMAAMQNPRYAGQRNARKDYVALAKDSDKAEDFLIHLSMAQASFINCAVTSIVPMNIYNDVSSLLDLRDSIPPYALAARMCMDLVRLWERHFDAPEPVECIFEQGDFGQGKFSDLMVDEGMALPVYKKKEDFPGIQAADHYAWERAFMMREIALGVPRPPRKSLHMLLAIPKLHVQATQTSLVNVCHLKKIDPKTGVRHDS